MTGPALQERADDGHRGRRQVGPRHPPQPARQPPRLLVARHRRPRAHAPRGHARLARRAPLWLQEGVAKREEIRWRAPGPFDDRPSPDAVVQRGLELNLGLPLDKLGPSIAMLPSADAAMVAFAEVTSFVRYYARDVRATTRCRSFCSSCAAARSRTRRSRPPAGQTSRRGTGAGARTSRRARTSRCRRSSASAASTDDAEKLRDLRDRTRLAELLLPAQPRPRGREGARPHRARRAPRRRPRRGIGRWATPACAGCAPARSRRPGAGRRASRSWRTPSRSSRPTAPGGPSGAGGSASAATRRPPRRPSSRPSRPIRSTREGACETLDADPAAGPADPAKKALCDAARAAGGEWDGD